MIVLTRLNGPSFALNPDLIERVEANPDTVVVLVGGASYRSLNLSTNSSPGCATTAAR